jgi:hypothetical protein
MEDAGKNIRMRLRLLRRIMYNYQWKAAAGNKKRK